MPTYLGSLDSTVLEVEAIVYPTVAEIASGIHLVTDLRIESDEYGSYLRWTKSDANVESYTVYQDVGCSGNYVSIGGGIAKLTDNYADIPPTDVCTQYRVEQRGYDGIRTLSNIASTEETPAVQPSPTQLVVSEDVPTDIYVRVLDTTYGEPVQGGDVVLVLSDSVGEVAHLGPAATDANGVVKFTVTVPEAAQLSAVATFQGLPTYTASTSGSVAVVAQEIRYATVLDISGPSTVLEDEPVTFTITLTTLDGQPVSGTVFVDGTPVQVVNGAASVVLTFPVGTHTVTATFEGYSTTEAW